MKTNISILTMLGDKYSEVQTKVSREHLALCVKLRDLQLKTIILNCAIVVSAYLTIYFNTIGVYVGSIFPVCLFFSSVISLLTVFKSRKVVPYDTSLHGNRLGNTNYNLLMEAQDIVAENSKIIRDIEGAIQLSAIIFIGSFILNLLWILVST